MAKKTLEGTREKPLLIAVEAYKHEKSPVAIYTTRRYTTQTLTYCLVFQSIPAGYVLSK
ncbi:MAG: hypothetical protein PHU52_04395 [Dehalococcoidales bacterium]|nr:hypothetical protein [Dehalococcoidales bacterium]